MPSRGFLFSGTGRLGLEHANWFDVKGPVHMRTKGQTHAIRNNPSHYLGASAYRGIALVALCGRLGSSAGRYSGFGPDHSFDPSSYRQDLNPGRIVASEVFDVPWPKPLAEAWAVGCLGKLDCMR